MIKRVHLVFKTHLDIGFTDLAAAVTQRYMTQFIPSAIKTSETLRSNGSNERMVWTTGSWLIAHYLEHAAENDRKKLEQAIEEGDITWHALPFTTHTELMDAHLFRFGMSLSKRLDERFSHTTIAAKMTDVPGHTIALVPLLASYGIQYLHIGVNGGSRVPSVPPIFRWQAPDGSEVIVQYDGTYGSEHAVEGMEDALVIEHGADNMGPPSVSEVHRAYERIAKKFPGAEIVPSTLDAYANALLRHRDRLPVVTSEIGDTWIHGVGSDPAKVARFRMFLRLADTWVRTGTLDQSSVAYRHFMEALLMVPEHTWGLDTKKYLADYRNWAPEDFVEARKRDTITADAVPPEYQFIEDFVKKEYDMLLPGNARRRDHRTYSFFESSHTEQRAYLDTAYEALPSELQRQADEAQRELVPRRQDPMEPGEAQPIESGTTVLLPPWTVVFADDGAIVSLTGAAGRELVVPGEAIGRYSYETFDCAYYEAWHKAYNRDFEENKPWLLPDAGKPGMERVQPPVEHRLYGADLQSLTLRKTSGGYQVTAQLERSPSAPYGAPRTIVVRYVFSLDGTRLSIDLDWFDKQATRLPEALWMSICPGAKDNTAWRMVKLGTELPLLDSVAGGARYVHAVEALRNRTELGVATEVTPIDSPLVSIDERHLLYMDDRTGGICTGAFHFALCNNLWGTNFPMWYEQDGRSRFSITWKPAQRRSES